MGVKFTEEQQAVIDARDCNILVSAAAGSGKTAVLVERIIQMIIEGSDIDHLLVVTFTKAAASQMKEKITIAIQNKLMEEPDNKHLQRQETLIHNAQITTIDSFCQYVLKNNFNTIGVDPSFRVGDDGELKLLQEETMQELLEEEYGLAQGSEDSDFLFCMEYFSSGSSDKKVESYIASLFKFSMSMPWPEDWINERAGDYQLEGAVFDELPWVIDCVQLAKSRVKEFASKLEAAEKICCESDGPYMYGDMLDAEKNSVEAVLKYDTYDQLFDGLRVARNSFGRLPSKKDASVNVEKRDYVKDLRDSVKEGLSKLFESYFALPSDTIIQQMKLCDRAVKELCRLTIRYKQLFEAKKRERQLIDFSDMEHFALQILVDHPSEEAVSGKSCQEIIDMCTPSAVALEYRDYFREVLIDEYQDSNNVQELILKSISGEIPDKSERFMVGDVKQSIYKFRLARPEIFMDKLATYNKEPEAQDRRIDLHMNFRSRKEVLEATNFIFEKIMGKDLGSVEYDQDARLVTGASYEEPVMDMAPELIMFDSASDNENLSDYNAREKEALVIAERIHSLMEEDKNLKFKDIVILLRSLSGWDDTFKKILEEEGIPAYTESKSGYFNAFEVSVLLDILTVIDNPSLDIPLVSVMHSVIGGFDDEELARLRVLVDGQEMAVLEDSFYYGIRKLLSSEEKNQEDKELLEKTSGFVAFLDDLRTMSFYTPVHELLQHILDETGFDTYCLAMPAGNQRKANIDQLLARAYSFEKTSFKGLFHFVRYIEHIKMVQVDYGEAGIIDENANVVRIMSIHKSKGLEFPVVFVAGTTKGFNRMDTKGDLTLDMDLGIGVKCIDTDLRVKYDTLKRLIIADKMNKDSLGEELRVLYVALTRAKEKLIMTASVKKLSDEISKMVRELPVLAGGDTLLPYSLRAGADSYFDLILPSVIRHPEFARAAEVLGSSKDMFNSYIDEKAGETSFKFIFLDDDSIVSKMIRLDTLALGRRQELEEGAISFDGELKDRLKIKFESKYAFEHLKGLFTKTTVTELKKHKLEEMGETFANVAPYVVEAETDEAEFIEVSGDTGDLADTETGSEAEKEPSQKKEKRLTGADRGTAYHRVMEILDNEIYGDEDFMERVRADADGGHKVTPVAKRIYAWMGQQAQKGMIPEEYLTSVFSPDIEAFLKTDLGWRMGEAFRRGDLYREKPFMMGISAKDLSDKFPEDEMVLIQGIIDAWFVENGEIVLLDYKTDRVKEAGELVNRYSIQLDLYKQALERTTNMKVKEVLIYSFGLSQVVKM